MNNQIKTREGFTIIEVVLVLAIAALIMLMVFIALPALQRSQRDTQRKDDLSRLQAAITSYKSNERGKVPFKDGVTNDTANVDFIKDYVTLGEASAFADPQGPDYSFVTSKGAMTPGSGKIYVIPGKKCSDTIPNSSNSLNATSRGGALRVALESGGSHCIEY